MMVMSLLAWILGIVITLVLIFLAAYIVLSYSDLEIDLSPIDLARRLNPLVPVEYGIFALMFVLFLLAGHWVEVIYNLPVLAWYAYSYQKKQWKIDATKVYDNLDKLKKIAIGKLIFFLISLFVYLFRMVYYLVAEEEDY